MSKRARFDGPHDAVHIFHPETNEHLDTVQRGGLLSADVPAAIRDELLQRDNWSEVQQATPKTTEEKG